MFLLLQIQTEIQTLPVGTLVAYGLVVFVLLIFSALISGSEVAFFSLGPTEKDELKADDSRPAEIALKLLENPKELLATILIVNNFFNVGIIIFSSAISAQIFRNFYNDTWRFIAEVSIITFVVLVVGEVIPKVYATKKSISLAKLMARPLAAFSTMPPFSWFKHFLVNGTKFINKYARHRGVKISSDELEQALALTKEETTSEEEHKILEGIIKFGNTEVKQIMKSRLEVVSLDCETDFHAVLETILESGYSRIPVVKDSFDHVVGILNIKDLLPFTNEESTFEWKNFLRKPFFVPENKKIDDLLKDFQEKKMHLAIVVDEYGGVGGIITLEDVLEEIVGDITEEFDEEDLLYKKLSDSTYIFEGRTPLIDFYKVLDIDGKEFDLRKGEAESIGGFMVENAGRILKNNEFIKFEGFKLIVESSDKRRIKSIKVVIDQQYK